MRWILFLHKNDDPTETFDSKTDILKSSKSALKCNDELKEIENDLFNLINDIIFKKYFPEFQKS